MDELIILIIRGIVSLLGGGKTEAKRPPQIPQNWQPGPTAPQLPPEVTARIQQLQRLAGQSQQKVVKQQRFQSGKRRPPKIPVVPSAVRNFEPPPVESVVTFTPMTRTTISHITPIAQFTNTTLLLTPASLRQQVVMNEILQPPVALRDEIGPR